MKQEYFISMLLLISNEIIKSYLHQKLSKFLFASKIIKIAICIKIFQNFYFHQKLLTFIYIRSFRNNNIRKQLTLNSSKFSIDINYIITSTTKSLITKRSNSYFFLKFTLTQKL